MPRLEIIEENEVIYNCKYCSNINKDNRNPIKNHPECEDIYSLHKDSINEEFYKPQKMFIEKRRNQSNRTMSYCNNFSDILMISISSLTQFYKTIACVFLVIFTPKDCSNHDCSYRGLYLDKVYNTVAISIGLISFTLFFILYSFELVRENYLKTNLIYNSLDMMGLPGIHVYQKKGTDQLEREHIPKPSLLDFLLDFLLVFKIKKENDIINYTLYRNKIIDNIKKNLKFYNNIIQKISYLLIFVYVLNVIFSIIATKMYNDNQQAYIIIFTNIILISPKLYSSYKMTEDGEYNTNSVYLIKHVEYNDYSDKNRDDIEQILIEKRISFFKDPRNLRINVMVAAEKEKQNRNEFNNQLKLMMGQGIKFF